MAGFNPRWIVGKTIARVEMNPYKARDFGNELAHNPVIYFTDGSELRFSGEETDFGEYGVNFAYRRAP